MQGVHEFSQLIHDIKKYLALAPEPVATIYLNTSQVWDQNEEAKLILKNMIKEVKKDLEKTGLAADKVEKIVKPASNFLSDGQAWKGLKEGIAFFLSSHNPNIYLLPFQPGDSFLVDTYFSVKPMLQALYRNYEYYVLSLSQNEIEFYDGYAETLTKREEPNLPKNIDEALWADEPEISVQHKTSRKFGPRMEGAAIFHGHGSIRDTRDERLQRFCHVIDKHIYAAAKEKYLPLIVTCDKSLWPIFQEVSEYPNLIPECVPGGTKSLNTRKLGEKVWELMQKRGEENTNEAVEIYKNALGSDKVITNLEETTKAAIEGRVEILFLEPADTFWGKYEPETAKVVVRNKRGAGDSDLVNLSLIKTLDNGGLAYHTNAYKNVFKESLNALLRY